MRKYITETVGILEFLQIIITIVILALGFYGFSTDVTWNKMVEADGLNACVKINQAIFKKDKTFISKSECPVILDISNATQCADTIHKYYLTETHRHNELKDSSGKGIKLVVKYMKKFLKRSDASELSILCAIMLIIASLIGHHITANLSKNVELRTKWNAALQGIILFISGYAGFMLAVSTNAIVLNSDKVASQVQPCSMLKYCNRALDSQELISIDAVLYEMHACQDIHVKKTVCILLVLLIVMCIVMILLAMELTMKYEQESDEEQEALDKELENRIEGLIDDQPINFDQQGKDANQHEGYDGIPLLMIDVGSAQDFPVNDVSF